MFDFFLSVITDPNIGWCTLFDGVCSDSVKTGMFAVPTMWLQNIASMNVKGLGDNKTCRDVIQFIKGININICCIQDTHYTDKTIYNLSAVSGAMSVILVTIFLNLET